MLKTWLLNNSLDSIEVEECYQGISEEDRKDRYRTMSVFQLEKEFGTSPEAEEFIKDIIKGVDSFQSLFLCLT